jgi:hypothetical protein
VRFSGMDLDLSSVQEVDQDTKSTREAQARSPWQAAQAP